MKVQRDLEVQNQTSLLRTLLIQKICTKALLVEISHDEMYSGVTDKNVAYYPAYVKLVSRFNHRENLNHCVLAIFEL
jgi:hypothetical protein